MDRHRIITTSYSEKSYTTTSSENATLSFYNYTSSSNCNKQNVPNSLKYSLQEGTPRQRQTDSMKAQYLGNALLTKPTYSYDAQPHKPPTEQVPRVEANLAIQPHKSAPPIPTAKTESELGTGHKSKTSTSLLSRVFSFRSKLPKRGYALILNHETFKPESTKKNRTGTHHDVNKLKATFEIFNIRTRVKNDLTLAQIKQKVNKLTQTDFTKYDCFIIVILTHGEGRELHASDKKYDFIEVIEDPVTTNKTLVEKPKIFITHASRDETQNQTDAVPIKRAVVLKRNIFKCNAAYFHRPTLKGTYFVQAFCRHLEIKGKDYQLYNIMMAVNKEFSNAPDKPPEMPTIESTMTKPFCFGDLLK